MESLSPEAWRKREQLFLRFETSRQAEPALDLAEFVAAEACGDSHDILLELAKIDLEYRCESREALDEGLLSAFYFDQFPVLSDDDSKIALLAVEYQTTPAADRDDWISLARERYPEYSQTLLGWTAKDQPNDRTQPTEDRFPAFERYDVVGILGRGSFATVYQARHRRLERDVAIKLPHEDVLAAPDSRDRIMREARAAATLDHANIVPIYDVYENDDRVFIVSQLIEGDSLQQWIAQQDYDLPTALRWVADIADALNYAHLRGVIHRDVKPGNILITSTNQRDEPAPAKHGRAVLTDFGLARQSGIETLTLHGDLLGTPAYMSPEQARGDIKGLSGGSDVYSLGVVLYELLAERLPFDGAPASVLHQLQHEPPPPIVRPQGELPRDLQTICAKCLEKDARDRYATAGDLAEDLRRYLRNEPILARTVSHAERALKWARRRPVLAAVGVTILVLLGFVGGLALQLNSTRRQRDLAQSAEKRATTAEAEANRQLVASNESAARLAMQRGKFKEALTLLDEVKNLASIDTSTHLLLRAECHFLLRDFDAARLAIQQASQQQNTSKANLAGVAMWQAELAMLEEAPTPSARQLYKAAIEQQPAQADGYYIQGMLAERSHEAVRLFRKSLAANPFHSRARSVLVNMNIALGQLDDAEFEVQVGRQLFPDDPHFVLMDGLIAAAKGDMDEATNLAANAKIGEAERAAWVEAYQLLDELVEIVSLKRQLDQQAGQAILAGISAKESQLRLLQDSGWRLPVEIGKRFANLRKALTIATTESSSTTANLRPEFEALVEAHPEGTLLVLLGEYQLADDDLEAGRDTFLRAVETPSLLRDHHQSAGLGVIAPSATLALRLKREPKKNLKHAAEGLRLVDPAGKFSINFYRLFVFVSLATGEVELCRTWITRWESSAAPNDYDVLRNWVELELMAAKPVAAMHRVKLLLKHFPDDEYGLEKREAIEKSVLQGLGIKNPDDVEQDALKE